jgi:hypothetical protein
MQTNQRRSLGFVEVAADGILTRRADLLERIGLREDG